MDILNIRLAVQLFTSRYMVDDDLTAVSDLHADVNSEGACAMLCFGVVVRSERWQVEEARRLVNHALLLANEVSEPTRLNLLAMRDLVDALEGTSLRATPPAARLADTRSADFDLMLLRSRAMTARETYSEARQLCTIVQNRLAGRNVVLHNLTTYARIRNDLNANEYRLARAAMTAWEDRAPSLLRDMPVFALLQAWCAYSLGHADETLELIDKCIEVASVDNPAVRAQATALRGALHLMAGVWEAAVKDLRRVSSASIRFRNPTLLRHWADYTEACMMTSRLKKAATAVEVPEQRLSSHRSRWGDLAVMRCRAAPSNPLPVSRHSYPNTMGTSTDGINMWRAGCGGSRTSGSEGGQEKSTSRKAARALLSDPYTYVRTWTGFVYVAFVIACYSGPSWASTPPPR